MLVSLLSRLSDNEFTNKNIDFHIDVDFTRDKTLNAGKELVSFDVVSFFTKKTQLLLPSRLRRRDLEKMPP